MALTCLTCLTCNKKAAPIPVRLPHNDSSARSFITARLIIIPPLYHIAAPSQHIAPGGTNSGRVETYRKGGLKAPAFRRGEVQVSLANGKSHLSCRRKLQIHSSDAIIQLPAKRGIGNPNKDDGGIVETKGKMATVFNNVISYNIIYFKKTVFGGYSLSRGACQPPALGGYSPRAVFLFT